MTVRQKKNKNPTHLAILRIFFVLVISGQKIVNGQIHVEIRSLEFANDQIAALSLQYHLEEGEGGEAVSFFL